MCVCLCVACLQWVVRGFTAADLVAWALLGTVCGLVGAVFVAVLDSLSKLRNHFIRKDLDERTRRRRVFGTFWFWFWFSGAPHVTFSEGRTVYQEFRENLS